jgi:hypothetical protein
VVQWYDSSGESSSILLDVFDVTPGEPIHLMEISRQVRVMARWHLGMLHLISVCKNPCLLSSLQRQFAVLIQCMVFQALFSSNFSVLSHLFYIMSSYTFIYSHYV